MQESPKKQRKTIKEVFAQIGNGFVSFFKEIGFLAKFLILLFFVFIFYLLQRTGKRKLDKPMPKIRISLDPIKNIYSKLYNKVIAVFDTHKPHEVKSADLIFLALRNLSHKKNRTYVTILGMGIGFGAVILLLSLGYGFERLVVSRVASLSEMKQIDVNTSQGSLLTFNYDIINKISDIEKVDSVIPVVTSVSKVTYNNAVSDVIVYGVSTRYFEETGLSLIKGTLFKEEEFNLSANDISDDKGVVAGASTILINQKSFKQEISKVKYSIYPLVWKPVYTSPDTNSKIIGYTKRDIGVQDATEVWGYSYTGAPSSNQGEDFNGNRYSPWVEDSFSLWKEENCKTTNPDCVEGKYLMIRNMDSQKITKGYVSEDSLSVERYQIVEGSALEVYSGKVIDNVTFNLKPIDYTNIYPLPETNAQTATILEMGKDEKYKGELIYGEVYDAGNYVKNDNGVQYGYWVKTEMSVWAKSDCKGFCSEYFSASKEEGYVEKVLTLYIKASDVEIDNYPNKFKTEQVLGAETTNEESSSVVSLDSLSQEDDGIDWVSISSELGTTEDISKDVVSFPENAQKIAMVNSSMLNLLGLSANEAEGKSFEATIIFDSKLFDKSNYLVESKPTSFVIGGVVSDSKTPTFYIPLSDITVEGMVNVSQLKIVVDSKEDVLGVRTNIEGMGFQTGSVVDTVDSISSLFKTLRIALVVLGLIALGVASLGMFNTLTVSLLEKSREVGLLKTMGLKSYEVKTLFLSESIIMSVLGGVAGLLFAFLAGKLISILLTLLAVTQGQSALDVAYIPFVLGALIILLSSVVGLVTGWYPAKRAKDIPALNALRYE